jgi:Zn ribbon nucleic-acid-binding protein
MKDIWLQYVLRPLGRLIGTGRWEPHAVGPVHCVACGHRSVAVIITTSPCYNAETEAFDQLECSSCGKFTMCSE